MTTYMDRNRTRRGRRHGSVLVATLYLSILSAMTALWLVLTLIDNQTENKHRRSQERAFLAADSGVDMVLNWGNNPDDYDGGGATGLFYRATDGSFPNLTSAKLGTSGVTVPTSKLPTFASKYGIPLGSIESIKIEAPESGAPACLFKVESVGKAETGKRRRVIAYMDASPLATTSVALPAGLLSLASAGQGGNGNVHWGEAWSKTDFHMLNKSQLGNLDRTSSSYDKWAKYRTEGTLIFPSNWNNNFTGGTPKKNAKYDLNTTVRQLGTAATLTNGATVTGDYSNGQPSGSATEHSSFEQFIPVGVLQWPDFLSKYQTFKDQAKAHGRYYGTDASGSVYRDGIINSAHLVDFTTEFGEANRETSPYDLVFIDTIDKNPPNATGSNLATVTNAGSGIGMKGIFWIGANYVQTGAGNPATLNNSEKPDGTVTPISKVYLDGILYSAGTIDFGGNPVIYGSVMTQNGFVGGGTPEIYYNHKLATGLNIPTGNAGSVFHVVRHQNQGMGAN